MDNFVEGKNAVIEALNSGRHIEKVLIAKTKDGGSSVTINKIIALAKEKGVIVQNVPRQKLDDMAESKNHQGVGAFVAPIDYVDIEEILEYAKSKNEEPFIVILDHISDPYNLGAVIRTAETAGAHGVIIPNRRAAVVTPIAEKAAAGAVSFVPICKVANIVNAIERLKKDGIWIYAATQKGKHMYRETMTGPIAVVIGSEGEGVSPLVRKKCDFDISIPMYGQLTSLNASVSAGIVLYEVVRQRKFDK